MKLALQIIAAVFLSLVLLVLVAVFVLPKTGIGQNLIDRIARPIIEDAVASSLGSEIEFAPIRGALPGELILEDVSLSEDGEVWVSVDRAHLVWSPLALIGGTIEVKSLSVRSATLYRLPEDIPEGEEEPQADDGEGGLPDLPEIVIGRISIKPLSIREPVLGDRYDLMVEAGGRYADRKLSLETTVDSNSGSDLVTATIDFDGRRLTLDTDVLSRPDGLLATLAGAEGAVWAAIEGDGRLEDWAGTIEGEIGGYGAVGGALSGNLRDFSAAGFEGVVRPGPLLPEDALTVIGEEARMALSTTRDEETIAVRIENLSARFGGLSGTVTVGAQDFDSFTADLDGTLSDAVMSDYGVPELAGPLTLEGQAQQQDDAWAFSARLGTAIGRLAVENGRYSPDTPFSGQIAADLTSIPRVDGGPLSPVLAEGLTLRGGVTYSAEGEVAVRDLDARLGRTSGRRLTLSGSGRYGLETERFEADVTARAGAQTLALLQEAAQFEGPLSLQVSASGTPADLTADLRADIPAGRIEDTAFAAGSLTAKVVGDPMRPTADLTLTSTDGSYRGRVDLDARERALVLNTLSFSAGQITLDGTGRFDPSTETVTADISLETGEDAQLITGETISGQARITGTASLAEGVDATIEANGLRYADYRLDRLQAVAEGPAERIGVSVTARGADLGAIFLTSLDTDAIVRMPEDGPTTVSVSRLIVQRDSDEEAERITLEAPTTLTLGEAITLAETRLDWLGDGRIVAEATYGPQRWVATVSGQDVPLPQIGAPLTFSVDLDTDRDVIARANASASRQADEADTDDEAYRLTLEALWGGETIDASAAVRQGSGDPLVTAQIGYPLALTRGPDGLGIELPDGELDGQILIDGPVAAIEAFLPDLPVEMAGQLSANIAVSGTPSAPTAEGSIGLRDGRIEDQTIGLALTNLSADGQVAYRNGRGDGTIELVGSGVSGRANAVRLNATVSAGTEDLTVDSRLQLDRAQLVQSPDLSVRASSDIRFAGPIDDLALTGSLTIEDANIQIAALTGFSGGESVTQFTPVDVRWVDGGAPETEGGEDEASKEPPPVIVDLDLSIEARNAVYVRGRGLDSEWAIDLDIGGTSAEPLIGGEVRNLQGTFEFAGRTFDIAEGRVIFNRQDPISPRLDVAAVYDTGEIEARVELSGPATDPSISLSSDPARPEEEVMALVLFGKPPNELSEIESLRLALAVGQLTGVGPLGGGGGGFQSALRGGLGLDELSLGYDAESEQAQVEVGKYLTDDFYVGARQAVGDAGTEVTITYEVTDNITLESTLEPSGSQSVSANYKKDY